jgi:hypothetical protein
MIVDVSIVSAMAKSWSTYRWQENKIAENQIATQV